MMIKIKCERDKTQAQAVHVAAFFPGKDLLVQAGVGFHPSMCQLDHSYQILALRVGFPSVGFAVLTDVLHAKAYPWPKVGGIQSSSPASTARLLPVPSLTTMPPINPASNK